MKHVSFNASARYGRMIRNKHFLFKLENLKFQIRKTNLMNFFVVHNLRVNYSLIL